MSVFLVLFKLIDVFMVVHDEVLEECIVVELLLLTQLTLLLDKESEDVSELLFKLLGDCGLSIGCELLDEIEIDGEVELDAELLIRLMVSQFKRLSFKGATLDAIVDANVG
jgi:hypothetical protein